MAVLRVNPTRMELSKIKKRLVMATRGHKLLKDKRDEMVRQFIILIKKNKELRTDVERELSKALGNFAMARAVMDPKALEEAMLYPARNAKIDIKTKNVMSVNVPTIIVDENSLTESTLSYGLTETSAQLDDAIARLADILPKMI
ncbi:MAG: V-type ATP synthase subunit D, partial [Christensenellaceae bacterium]|nr:V-type ATP synthase subunit D [Christensenellaceae bacterium]